MTASLAFIFWAGTNLRAIARISESEQALQIAEAGIDYYRWRLAHEPDDYQDGTGGPGPYVHDFLDKDDNVLGQFSLTITPPGAGESEVTIESVGTLTGSPQATRSVRAVFNTPTVVNYSVITDEPLWITDRTQIWGKTHSNQGVRFDGWEAGNLVTASVETYDDPSHTGPDEYGVHTHDITVDPLPPSPLPDRPDVFGAGREFPVPEIDFDGIIGDLAALKADAQTTGTYIAKSDQKGWMIDLRYYRFRLFKVLNSVAPPQNCTAAEGGNDPDWDTWTYGDREVIGWYDIPDTTLFFEDNVWVNGPITREKFVIGAARFPDTPGNRKNIIIQGDISYYDRDARENLYDGSTQLTLIAQNNINVSMDAETTLSVDATLIAQNGRVGRHYYGTACAPYDSLILAGFLGAIISQEPYVLRYDDGTGYDRVRLRYDGTLGYNPSPYTPEAAGNLELVSWEEF